MSWYLGAVFASLGLLVIYKTVEHRRAVIEARARLEAEGRELPEPKHPASAMAVGVTPIFAMGLFFMALAIGAISFTVDTRGLISPIDIAGFVFLAGAYSVWMIVRTLYSGMGLGLKGEAKAEDR